MATISSPASFSSVRTAFNTEGYGISTSFFAYRRGGGIVPATSGFNAIGEGTVGSPLQMTQFNGFSVPSPIVVDIDDVNVFNDVVTPTAAFYELNSDGNIYISNYGLLAPWKLSGASSLYEVYMGPRLGGSLEPFVSGISSAVGSWISLGTTRSWHFQNIAQSSDFTEWSVGIRLASSGTLLDSATITFNWIGNF
jgi:hypothetical protein